MQIKYLLNLDQNQYENKVRVRENNLIVLKVICTVFGLCIMLMSVKLFSLNELNKLQEKKIQRDSIAVIVWVN